LGKGNGFFVFNNHLRNLLGINNNYPLHLFIRKERYLMQNRNFMLALGLLALTRPLMKIVGLIQIFGNEAIGSIIMTLLISFVWIIITVKKELENPVQVLVGAGVCYAILVTIASGILSPLLDGRLQGPLSNPVAFISVFFTNVVWGLITGSIAAMILSKRINK